MSDQARSHAGSEERSERVRRVLRFIRGRGLRGATTLEGNRATNVQNFSTCLSDLRALGHVIESRFVETRENGSRVHRFFYRGRVDHSTRGRNRRRRRAERGE